MLIELKDINYTYMPGTAFSQEALKSVNLHIVEGEFISVIGPTGSGKSTLLQLLGGLILPTSGKYIYYGKQNGRSVQDNVAVDFSDSIAGHEVGLVFQFPEAQLFEETVEKDIAFGPRNLGFSEDIVKERVKDSIAQVGLEYEKIAHRSPFELSGGEKRLVAIAGVLAMNPRVLMLDEPTSGLDAAGKDHIMHIISYLNNAGTTIILITHDMDDVADFSKRVVVLDKGRVILDGAVGDIFSDKAFIDTLNELGLGIPTTVQVLLDGSQRGLPFELGTVESGKVINYILEVCGSRAEGNDIDE